MKNPTLKGLKKTFGGLAITIASILGTGCSREFSTPNLYKDIKASQLTEKDTPYTVKEIVYGKAGNLKRVYVAKIPKEKQPTGIEDYLQISLIPIETGVEIADLDSRTMTVEGDNYVLKRIGKQTKKQGKTYFKDIEFKISGKEGYFQDYFNSKDGINIRNSKDTPFKIKTVKINGEEFYKLLPQDDNNADTLEFLLMRKKGSEVIFNRKAGNRIILRGETYRPYKTIFIDTPKPSPDAEGTIGEQREDF